MGSNGSHPFFGGVTSPCFKDQETSGTPTSKKQGPPPKTKRWNKGDTETSREKLAGSIGWNGSELTEASLLRSQTTQIHSLLTTSKEKGEPFEVSMIVVV